MENEYDWLFELIYKADVKRNKNSSYWDGRYDALLDIMDHYDLEDDYYEWIVMHKFKCVLDALKPKVEE